MCIKMSCSHFIKCVFLCHGFYGGQNCFSHLLALWLLCLLNKPLLSALFAKHWARIMRCEWTISLRCTLSRERQRHRWSPWRIVWWERHVMWFRREIGGEEWPLYFNDLRDTGGNLVNIYWRDQRPIQILFSQIYLKWLKCRSIVNILRALEFYFVL